MPLFGRLPFLRASSPFHYWGTESSQTNPKRPILEIRSRSGMLCTTSLCMVSVVITG